MDYKRTLDYLFSQLPMYHLIGAAAYKADLNNITEICGLLNNPQNEFRSVHVAGTNGKGSVSHFLASIFQENGYRTGLFTSPHLKDFRERIRVNGKMIPKSNITAFVEKYHDEFKKIKPSFFEWTTALTFDYFKKEKVDIAIIETGLGGRLDSTNIIVPAVSVITNISWDHSNLLGDTLEKITNEKAGIIKENIPVVIGDTQPHSRNIFAEKAKEKNAEIFFADHIYKVSDVKTDYEKDAVLKLKIDAKSKKNSRIFQYLPQQIISGLAGNYQEKNIRTVCAAIDTLLTKGYEFSERNILKGFANVVKNTGILGRWQKLSESPLTFCDIGHNTDGIKEIVTLLKKIKFRKLHVVFGLVNDKDVDSILSVLPRNAEYYFCKAAITRALNDTELLACAVKHGLKGRACGSVRNAYGMAKESAHPDDLIYIGGSTFVVAEVL